MEFSGFVNDYFNVDHSFSLCLSINIRMILANGDSWTGGPTYNSPMDHWPNCLSQRQKIPMVNLACGGASNQRIFRTTLEYLYGNNPQPDYLIIGWSILTRYEFPSDQGHWARITVDGCNEFLETGMTVPDLEQFKKLFYGSMYHEQLMQQAFRNNLLVLQDLCSSKNIKLINFNSADAAAKPWLLNDSKVDLSTWFLPPDQSMSRHLSGLGFAFTKSYHIDPAGQRFWARSIANFL